MATWRDYVRALWGAVQLTLRGETIQTPPPRYPTLAVWSATCLQRVEATFAAAEAQQLDETARKNFTLPLEGRPISMQTILAAVRFNHTQEYPHLIRSGIEFHLTAIYAANLNDQFRVQKLAEALGEYPSLQAQVQQLADQLQAIPPTPSEK